MIGGDRPADRGEGDAATPGGATPDGASLPPQPVRTVVVRLDEAASRRRLPRPPRRLILGAVGVVVLVVVGLLAVQALRGPGGRHADGNGILASTGTPDAHNSYGRAARSTGPMTGGIRLCLERGTEPAEIESVGPDSIVGSGWRLLGASVRVFTPSDGHSPIVSMDGYPPALPDPLQPAVGFGVTTPCGDLASGIPYTELLIGLQATDPAGGGWDGIDVTYRVGATEYVLVVRQALVQCGTAPLPAYCTGS